MTGKAENGLYPTISNSEREHEYVLKLQNEVLSKECDNLFIKLNELEKELKHYKKLKRRWKIFRNILHYSKYPISVLLIGGDIALIFTGIGIPIAIAGACVTGIELLGTNIIEDTLVTKKVNKYEYKITHLKEWIDKMYIFRCEALHDGKIDQKEIDLWRKLLNEYSESLNSVPKKSEEERRLRRVNDDTVDLKKLQEQINLLIKKQGGS
jgi:hypothetical protein